MHLSEKRGKILERGAGESSDLSSISCSTGCLKQTKGEIGVIFVDGAFQQCRERDTVMDSLWLLRTVPSEILLS